MKNIGSRRINSGNLWPYGIIATFVVFASGLAAYVTVACSNDVELVAKNYYQQEIEYEAQMKRIERTRALGDQVSILPQTGAKGISIALPTSHVTQGLSGTIHCYYPADVAEDETHELSLSSRGIQELGLPDLKPGFWRLKINWSHNQQDYYFAQELKVSESEIALR